MLRTLRTTEPRSTAEQTAYDKWFDQRSDRENGRADRIHGAEGVIPLAVWIVLLIASGVIFVYMLFFADSAERAIVQATMMGGVAVVITSTLLLLVFLDHPYRRGPLRERESSSRATRRGPPEEPDSAGAISELCPSVESRAAGPGIGYFPDVFGSLFNRHEMRRRDSEPGGNRKIGVDERGLELDPLSVQHRPATRFGVRCVQL